MTKIMLVEDDNNLREIYEARLAAEGFDIVAAQNGEEALAIASKEHPEMIISDVMMPKISGFEMLDILRNTDSLKDVKIIMLTALGQSEDSQRANSLGADRYLVKSQVTLEDIVKAAHELLDNGSGAPAQNASPAAAPTSEAPSQEQEQKQAAPMPTTEATVAPEPYEASPVQTAEESAAAPAVESQAASVPEQPSVQLPVVSEPEESMTPTPVEPNPVISIPVTDYSADEPANGNTLAQNNATTSPAAAQATSDISSLINPAPQTSDNQPAQEPATLPVSEPTPVAEETKPGTESIEPETASAPTLPEENIEFPTGIALPPDPEAPASDSLTEESTGEPIEDYTSPESFDKFQVSPAASAANVAVTEPETQSAAEVEVTESEPQSAADEEASIKSKIDEFINSQEAVVAEPATPETSDSSSLPFVQPSAEPQASTPDTSGSVSPASEQPVSSIGIAQEPAVIPTEPPVVTAVNLPQPATENSDTFQPPSSSTQTIQPTAAPDMPVGESTGNDQLVKDAATGIEPSAASPVVQNNDPVKKRVIAPLSGAEATPNIHQLLAIEEAKVSAQQAAMGQSQNPTPNVSVYAPTANVNPQPTQTNNQEDDPNSISL